MPRLGKQISHPIYPRPVSPLHYEPLYNRPEDILWEEDSAEGRNDDGDDEGVHQAKKRRIEKLGEAYLRGDGLFILSASIRGPLGENWVNPWKKKRAERTRESRGDGRERRKREVPETIGRGGNEGDDEDATLALERRKHMIEKAVEDGRNAPATTKVPDGRELSLQHNPSVANNADMGSRNRSEVPHGKDWLKRDYAASTSSRNIYADDFQQQQQASPSSRIRRPPLTDRAASSGPEQGQIIRPDIDATDPLRGRGETSATMLGNQPFTKSPCPRTHGSVKKEQENLSQTTSRVTESGAEYTSFSECHPPENTVQDGTAKQARSDSETLHLRERPTSRAENPSLRPSCPEDRTPMLMDKPLTIVSQIDDPLDSRRGSPHLSWTDARLARPKQQLEAQSLAAHHPQRNMPPHPTLSTETSSITVGTVMPSAQVAPTLKAPASTESLTSTADKLIKQAHEHSRCDEGNSFQSATQAAIAAAHLRLQHELATPRVPEAPQKAVYHINANLSTTESKSTGGNTPFGMFNKPSPKSTSHGTMNTQEMLDATTPFHLTTTVKKIPLKTPQHSISPLTAAHQKAGKKEAKVRKHTSSARDTTTARSHSRSDSSQGSIKTSWKVSKHGAERASGKTGGHVCGDVPIGSCGPSEFGKLGLDMATSEEEDEENVLLDLGEDVVVSSKPTTSTTTITSSKKMSSVAAQDAQKRTHKAPLPDPISPVADSDMMEAFPSRAGGGDGKEGEVVQDDDDGLTDNFDLSAAMDEVGSFLQSWDTDREMHEIEKMKSHVIEQTTTKKDDKHRLGLTTSSSFGRKFVVGKRI